MELPDDYMPDWLKSMLLLLVGGTGVHYLRVILENRRLAKKDFREVMLDRIRELELTVRGMHRRIENLTREMAHLEAENQQLREDLAEREREKP